MDKEMIFGTNSLSRLPDGSNRIGLPDPRFCNTMLAIMRVLHMSGAADVLDKIRDADEEMWESDSSMGISDAYDNLSL